jgi:hypothetical protein
MFVELTNTLNKKVLINVNHIVSMNPSFMNHLNGEKQETTAIHTTADNGPYPIKVMEPYGDVKERIRQATRGPIQWQE